MPQGPCVLAVFNTETTGLSVQVSCVTQGRLPFNKYLLPDKKFITENTTKIHDVSVKYQNGTKQYWKRMGNWPTMAISLIFPFCYVH